MTSLQALTISAAGDAAIDGKLLAGGPLSIDAIGKIAAGADAKLQAGALRLDAGRDLTLAGLAETNAGMTLARARTCAWTAAPWPMAARCR